MSFAGDGCFLMNGQEFATAVQHGANIVIVGRRQRHVRHDPHAPGARVSDARARHRAQNPDFAAYARAFGGHGETVEKTADFAAAFERALAAGKPAIIHVKTDPEALTSRITLEQAARAGAGSTTAARRHAWSRMRGGSLLPV